MGMNGSVQVEVLIQDIICFRMLLPTNLGFPRGGGWYELAVYRWEYWFKIWSASVCCCLQVWVSPRGGGWYEWQRTGEDMICFRMLLPTSLGFPWGRGVIWMAAYRWEYRFKIGSASVCCCLQSTRLLVFHLAIRRDCSQKSTYFRACFVSLIYLHCN